MEKSQRFIKRIVVLSILFILIAPFILTRSGFETMSFLNTGQIGDTIGGISSPIVGIVSIILLAYTLIEQLDFNRKQVLLQRQEQFKTTFFQLLQEQREITNSLYSSYEVVKLNEPTVTQKIAVKGQQFFRMGTFVLRNLFESMEYGCYCHSYNPEEIEQLIIKYESESDYDNYLENEQDNLHSFSLSSIKKESCFCFLNDKYKITSEEFESYKRMDIKQKIDFVYRRFFNVHEECGYYFRHLYRILYFVKRSEDEELNGVEDFAVRQQISTRYFELVQFVQAQMSTKELLMVFYNSFSFPKLRDLLIKYNILENLTVENLIDFSHNCIEGYHLKHQKI